MKTKIFILLFLLQFIVTIGKPQDSVRSVSTYKFSIQSISLNTSWYKPSMNYWNRTFLPSSGSLEKFNGKLIYGGNISFNLPLNLGARVGAWYWQEKVKGGGNATFNSLQIGLTGFSVGAFYRYPRQIVFGILPYVGIDGSYFIIQNKYDVGGNIDKLSGHDIAAMPFIGIERILIPKLVIGLEYGYVLGRYKQDVTTTDGSTYPKISINGHKIGITVGYKFP